MRKTVSFFILSNTGTRARQFTLSTAAVKLAEGWVRTGDAGFFCDRTGHLKIIDRAKDVGKLADGALFAPKYVENKLKFFSYIKEAVLLGNGKAYASALINMVPGIGPRIVIHCSRLRFMRAMGDELDNPS